MHIPGHGSVILAILTLGAMFTPSAAGSDSDLFRKRILPIVQSEQASSCTECHFAGVDLRNYIRKDEAETFAALRDMGLIDVRRPEKSKLLTFIARKPDHEDPLLARVREAEYKAFRDWITAAVADPSLLQTESTEPPLPTELPLDVVWHMRRDHVLNAFVESVWIEMGRCISCHSPDRNERLVKKHGEQMSWIVPHDPYATLQNLIDSGNIDLDDPEQSLVLLKPLGIEEHGGGPKFAMGGRTDKNFRRFLTDYANIVNGVYRRPDQLPPPTPFVTALTGQYLRIVGLPPDVGHKLLRVDIYRWLENAWSPHPWATADNPINGKRGLWQSMVLATAKRNEKRAEQLAQGGEETHRMLPAGRYLLKIYVDRRDKAKQDRDYELGEADYYGQVEIRENWDPGWKKPKIIDAAELKHVGEDAAD